MKRALFVTILLCFFIKSAFSQHFITDSNYRKTVFEKFEQRKNQFKEIKTAFAENNIKNLTQKQIEALKFLYAYMSLNDIVEQDFDYYLTQVNASFKAKEIFSWGNQIPEYIFRHFVLPPRINNENLDTARELFLNELSPRIKGLIMYQAALEVNHWCHEKVAYRGSDERTSSPLATILSAYGRCGEESTFAVTALRSVGIPARQCYTPRWAHTDDNHAWVEVWVDGLWYFLGACEPEPELNMGWFAQPAKRTMIVHTNVIGNYQGNEEVLLRDKNYTKINVLQNYANTKSIFVKTLDNKGQIAKNCKVKFKLYNYAEFYTIAEKNTDNNGIASLTTGLGDLLIWATDGNSYGYKKISVQEVDTVVISLLPKHKLNTVSFVDVFPPIERFAASVTNYKAKENTVRLQFEDSVRTKYMNTYCTKNISDEIAQKNSLSKDSVWFFIQKSEGNWREIVQFINENGQNKILFSFLKCLADKDLRDTKANLLTSHLIHIIPQNQLSNKFPYNIYEEGILSTRICNELISDWRCYFQQQIPSSKKLVYQKNPELLKKDLQLKIKLSDENHSRCPISPEGVYKLGYADIHSLNICFVAICKSIGIPARMDLATRLPQYFSDNRWIGVYFNSKKTIVNNKSILILKNDSANITKPQYYTHFTISQFENGDFNTLDYENNPLVKEFPIKLELKPGIYQVITGNRQNDGSVLTTNQFFELKTDEIKEIKISIREPKADTEKKVQISFSEEFFTTDNQKFNFQQKLQDKGLVIIFIDPAKEPTRHVINDIKLLKSEFEYWGGSLLIIVPQTNLTSAFQADKSGLPTNTYFAVDYNNQIQDKIIKTISLKIDYPITLLFSNAGYLLFHSTGYRIGIGEMLLKTISINKNSCVKP